MNDLRDKLREAPLSDAGARARALRVVQAAGADLEPVPPAPPALRALLAAGSWRSRRRRRGRRLRAGGRALGPGRARHDARAARAGARPRRRTAAGQRSRRRVGRLRGRLAAAARPLRGRVVVAERHVRGRLARRRAAGGRAGRRGPLGARAPGRVRAARWAPVDGFRIAYLAGDSLRVVNGDGTGDRRLAPADAGRAGLAADAEHVLAYADRRGRVRVVAVDLGLSSGARDRSARSASSSGRPTAPGSRSRTDRSVRVLDRSGAAVAAPLDGGMPPADFVVDDVAWSPRGELTVVRRGRVRSDVVIDGRRRFSGRGRLGAVAWSPDGRRLLVPWPSADRWILLGARRTAIGQVTRQFRGFPRAVEWCCLRLRGRAGGGRRSPPTSGRSPASACPTRCGRSCRTGGR